MAYDSREYVEEHRKLVFKYVTAFLYDLTGRMMNHDKSKLEEPEKSVFDEYTPRLQEVEYGSPEYHQNLVEMKEAIDHHFENNRHHPEHFENGVNGMNLVDVIEMFCDWKAANEKKGTVDFIESLRMNQKRFNMSDQLTRILINTAKDFGW